MKRSLTLLLLSLLISSAAGAQSAPDGVDERTARKVDELLGEWNKKDAPGCAVAIVKDGRTVLARGYGMANLDHRVPITPATVFNVASMSKQFTAMSIALLAEQGKLSLDDDIRKYVPEIPQYDNPITIRHLIYHTSGLRDYTNLIELSDERIENVHTDKDILNILARQKGLNFKPGTEHLYDNSGYVLLGIIVERVSGKSLGEFEREFIFGPLGMKNTRLYDDRTMIVPNRANGYFEKADGTYGMRASLWDRVGDGGLLTTVEDLALWDQNFYAPKVGSPALVSRLSIPGTLSNGQKFEYGFGLEPVLYRGLPMVMHGGGIRGYRAQMFRFPEQRTTLICLCNNGAISPTSILDKVTDVYLAGSFPDRKPQTAAATVVVPSSGSLDEKELIRFGGLFANKATDAVRRVYVKDSKLMYVRSGTSESELAPNGSNTFRVLGVTDKVVVAFAFRAGKPVSMSLIVNDTKPIVYDAVKPANELPAQLREYAGTYYSEELDAAYAIVLDEKKLAIQRRNLADVTLTPLYADVYMEDALGKIRFTRDKAGRIDGFVLNGAQVRGLEFKRRKSQ